jgi:hypothetical protein
MSCYQIFYYWYNREAKYGRMAMAKSLRGVNITAWSLLFGWLKQTSGGLILGDLIGQGVSVVYLQPGSVKI